jgi:hypothetical protein
MADDRDQVATIGDGTTDTIPFSGYRFTCHSRKYYRRLRGHPDSGNLTFDGCFKRDSVIQFLKICQGEAHTLTRANVFEVDLLCREWEIEDATCGAVRRFIEGPPAGSNLLICELLFRFDHRLDTSELESRLRGDFVKFVNDNQLIEVPVSILSRIVDFSIYGPNSFESVFEFCVRYFKEHGASASQIFRTLKVSELSKEHLICLCSLKDLHWCFLSESVGLTIVELVTHLRSVGPRLELQSKLIADAEDGIRRARDELDLVKQQLTGELENLKNAFDHAECEHTKRLANVEEQNETLTAKVSEQGKIITAQETRIADIERRFLSLESRNGVQESAILSLEGEIGKLAATAAAQDKTITSQNGELVQMKEEITMLKKMSVRHFPPSVKKVGTLDVPDGIIGHLTKEYNGNVHDLGIVELTAGSFENEPRAAGGFLKSVADLETHSTFHSIWRDRSTDIPHTRNNWICYDFRDRKIVPTHYAIRTCGGGTGSEHLKSWQVETSVDGVTWREVDHREDSATLNGQYFVGIFAVAGGEGCRFVRLVNIGRNHARYDNIHVTGWEIFGSLLA